MSNTSNKPTQEHVEENATAFYNAAVKIVDAGALIMPYNQPLGTIVIKIAEALTDQIGLMKGFSKSSQNNKSCNTQPNQNKIELDEDAMKEVEALEKELSGELGDLGDI